MIDRFCLRLLIGSIAVLLAVSPSSTAPAPAPTVPTAPAPGFHLQEASIADVHRAILNRQLTATQLVGYYLKRIEAYNGPCVRGAVDPASGKQLGDIEPIANAGKVNALITLNLRGKRSETDKADSSAMLDALETAAQFDAEFAATGKL
jgi:amidase